MLSTRYFQRVGSLSLGFLLLSSVFPPNAQAGRYVLNQTTQTIKSYFGSPLKQSVANKEVTYIYSPPKFRQLFPQDRQNQFSFIFVNNRVQRIVLEAEFREGAADVMGGFKKDLDKFYGYIFGYQPPTWKKLSSKFSGNETINDYEYCLGDGVVTKFSLGGANQDVFGELVAFEYDTRCEHTH